MSDSKLLNKEVMNFFYKKEEGKSLSNFWECIIKIKDKNKTREYDNGECCFHGEKFIVISKLCKDEKRKKDLLEYGRKFLSGFCVSDGNLVKKLGRKFVLNKEELDLWNRLSIDVQIQICKYKFENYEKVKVRY